MQTVLFPIDFHQSIRLQRFQRQELGQLRASLPIKELAALLPRSKSPAGSKPWFDNEGKIALQFLKVYKGCSDKKLLARLNTDWALQLFCGIQLKESEEIKDTNLLWQIRKFVAQHLDIASFQSILIKHWKKDMEQTHVGMCDATCYESDIKYPTDVNLLWDSCQWINGLIRSSSKALKRCLPRNKYHEQCRRQLAYAKRRRKFKRFRIPRQRQLLYLLDKLLFQLDDIVVYWLEQVEQGLAKKTLFSADDFSKIECIGKIYNQQRFHFEHPDQSIPHRIVSLYKPFIRPIIRGKESTGGKRTEFGAKVNTWQVNGINFIEHLSFSAFHEGNRLKQGIAFHHKHFGKLRQLGADAIYATNENRRYCKKLNIATCFKPKGRRTLKPVLRKQQDIARKTIGTLRATVLEGSYGNDKNHYGLDKVRARNQMTEIAYIFFGMMTANAVKIATRKIQKAARKKAPPNGQQLAFAA